MKHPRIAQVVLTIFFVGLLATPAIIRRVSAGQTAHLDKSAALARHGFYLEEVSKQAGVNFLH